MRIFSVYFCSIAAACMLFYKFGALASMIPATTALCTHLRTTLCSTSFWPLGRVCRSPLWLRLLACEYKTKVLQSAVQCTADVTFWLFKTFPINPRNTVQLLTFFHFEARPLFSTRWCCIRSIDRCGVNARLRRVLLCAKCDWVVALPLLHPSEITD